MTLLYFVWANQRRRRCYIHHTAQFTWRRVQYSTARDNGAFLTHENKAGKMQSTINQLKHGKGHAVRNNGTRGVVSIDHTAPGYASCCMGYLEHTPSYHYCAYSTSFRAT